MYLLSSLPLLLILFLIYWIFIHIITPKERILYNKRENKLTINKYNRAIEIKVNELEYWTYTSGRVGNYILKFKLKNNQSIYVTSLKNALKAIKTLRLIKGEKITIWM